MSHVHSLSFSYTNITWLFRKFCCLSVLMSSTHNTYSKVPTHWINTYLLVFPPQQEMTDNSRMEKFCFDFFLKGKQNKTVRKTQYGATECEADLPACFSEWITLRTLTMSWPTPSPSWCGQNCSMAANARRALREQRHGDKDERSPEQLTESLNYRWDQNQEMTNHRLSTGSHVYT